MSDNQSLGTKLRDDLSSGLSVGVVSALLAVVALFAFTAVTDVTRGGVLLALNVAVFVPYAYEQYWPVSYSTGAAAAWTVSAALVTTGVFIGTYQAATGGLETDLALGVAFILTVAVQYGTAALFARVRRSG